MHHRVPACVVAGAGCEDRELGMQAALVLIWLAGLVYFMKRPREVDFLTIGFFAAALYFLPGLVGYTLSPTTPASPVKLPMQIAPEAYAVMIAVLSANLVGAIVWDHLRHRPAVNHLVLAKARSAGDVAFLCGVIGVLMTWVDSGGAAFAADKRVVMTTVGRWHVLWEMGASLGVLFAYSFGRRGLLLACMSLLLLDMYVGFRYAFGITFIALTALWLARRGRVALASLPKRYVILILLGGLFVISYQNLKEPLRSNDWTEIGRRLSNPVWYGAGILTSEPFTTQTILNEVIKRDFRTDSSHLWSASEHLILFSSSLGAESRRFNDIFQPALFPLVDHGLANNIWAQMWSAGGWPLLSVFIVLHVLVLMGGSYFLRTRDPALRAGVVLMFSYWAFYVHRNELVVQVGLEKQVLLTWLLCVGAGMLLGGALASGAPGDKEGHAVGTRG